MLATDLERRLAAVEAEVQQLKSLVPMAVQTPWWEKIVGSLANDPAAVLLTRNLLDFGQIANLKVEDWIS